MLNFILTLDIAIGIAANINSLRPEVPEENYQHKKVIFIVEIEYQINQTEIFWFHASEINNGIRTNEEDRDYLGVKYKF